MSSFTPSSTTSVSVPNPLKTKRSIFEPYKESPLSSQETTSRLKIRFPTFHSVASWSWGTPIDEVCGICQTPFEGCAPGVKYPGDECPVVWGKCNHAFHLQCVSTWLSGGKSTCPICRREWEFGEEGGAKKNADGSNAEPPPAAAAAVDNTNGVAELEEAVDADEEEDDQEDNMT